LPQAAPRHGQGARKSTGASARQSVAMATPAERSGTSAISLQVRTMGTGNHDVSVPAQVSGNLGRCDACHWPAAKATHSQAAAHAAVPQLHAAPPQDSKRCIAFMPDSHRPFAAGARLMVTTPDRAGCAAGHRDCPEAGTGEADRAASGAPAHHLRVRAASATEGHCWGHCRDSQCKMC
jgi:hypothetical protein